MKFFCAVELDQPVRTTMPSRAAFTEVIADSYRKAAINYCILYLKEGTHHVLVVKADLEAFLPGCTVMNYTIIRTPSPEAVA